MKFDAQIKDEGDFQTLCLESPKAIEVYNSLPKDQQDLFIDEDVKKLDFENESILHIQSFLISHDLSWVSF